MKDNFDLHFDTLKSWINEYNLNYLLSEFEKYKDFQTEIEYFNSELEYIELEIDKCKKNNFWNELIFRKHCKKIICEYLTNITPIQENNNVASPETSKYCKAFCVKMELDIPRKHFLELTKILSSDKKPLPFFTVQQFELFIEKAFLGNTEIEKIECNLIKINTNTIINLFYRFYVKYSTEYFNTKKGNRENFIRLLTENILGFDFPTVKNNFK